MTKSILFFLVNQIKNLLKPLRLHFDTITFFVFGISLFIFILLLLLKVPTDIPVHAISVSRIATKEVSVPANFIYYLIVYILAFGQFNNITFLYLSSAFVLSIAVTSKYLVTRHILETFHYLQIKHSENHIFVYERDKFWKICNQVASLYSITLLFCFSLPLSLLLRINNKFYIGNITPNVWHNSTTILLVPVALVTFWISYLRINSLQKKKNSTLITLTILIIVGLLIKPSYFFVFLISYPIMIMFNPSLRQNFLLEILPVLAGLGLLILQYILIYYYQSGNISQGESSVTINLFLVWSHLSDNIFLSIMGSLVFPTICLILFFRQSIKSLIIRYATLQYVISILIFITFSEAGPRQYDGNFFWQCTISSYILFLAFSCLSVDRIINSIPRFCETIPSLKILSWKNIFQQISVREKIILITMFTHLLSGIIYLLKTFIFNNYS